jgi:hypothetical protein
MASSSGRELARIASQLELIIPAAEEYLEEYRRLEEEGRQLQGQQRSDHRDIMRSITMSCLNSEVEVVDKVLKVLEEDDDIRVLNVMLATMKIDLASSIPLEMLHYMQIRMSRLLSRVNIKVMLALARK